MTELMLKAKKRVLGERKASRKFFRAGEIPAVYYSKEENLPLTINRLAFEKHMQRLQPNSVFELEVDGKKYRAFVRDYSVFLKSQRVQHIDFLGILENHPFTVKIPLRHTGLSKGVVRGGVMRRFVNAVAVRCTSAYIPEEIVVDVAKLDIGDYIYISDLAELNEKLTFLETPQKAVIAVVASRASIGLGDEEGAEDGGETADEEKSNENKANE